MQPRTSAPSLLSRRQAIFAFATSLGALLAARFTFAEGTFIYGQGVDGHNITTLAASGTKYIAAIFVATDCPISNRYLPLLARLAKQFAPHGARLWLVYPNPEDTLVAVRTHQAQYPDAAAMPELIVPDPRFLAHAHVHVTPEAAIFPAGNTMTQPTLWHGRIDDRYLTFGTQRPVATRHDFTDALDAVLAGRQPALPAAPPVGCAIIPRTLHT
jgi:hypothetical protein